MTETQLESQSSLSKGFLVQIYNFILGYQKFILIVALILTLLLSLVLESINAWVSLIPQTSMRTTLTILETSVNKWVDAFFMFANDLTTSTDLLGFTFSLIDIAIDRLYAFITDMVIFYQHILTFNFSIISSTGYILMGIFVVTPLILVLICIQIFVTLKRQISPDKSYMNVFSGLITPRNLFIIVLLFPFTLEITWLPAIIALLLLAYYFILESDVWRKSDQKQHLLFSIAWKKAIVFLLCISLLCITILGFLSDSDFTLSSFLGFDPQMIIFLIIIGVISFVVVWIFTTWYTQKDSFLTIQSFGRKICSDYLTLKPILSLLLLIVFFLPCFDSLILQGSSRDLSFILLNFPWIIGSIFFDPFQFLEIVINAITVSFDLLITTIREIANDIIPINPSQPSIFGSLQPSFFQTAVFFLIFLLLLSVFAILVRRKIYKEENWRSTLSKHFSLIGIIIPITVVLAIIFYFFNPEIFLASFGSQYEVNTDAWEPILLIATTAFLGVVIMSMFAWSYIQIYRKGRSIRIILRIIIINFTAVFVSIIMITPFVWMIKNSIQTNTQNIGPFETQGLIPDPLSIANYAQLFGLISPSYETLEYRVITWLFNSLVTAVSVTAFLVLFSAMAGYCLAKRDFIGRRALIAITVGIMFVPSYVQVIPLYLELNRLGFVGSLLGVIFPFLIQPFSVFLCTEFMRSIPDDYLDAARVDGYSELQIFWKIVLPLSLPVISVMTIINFIGNWNAFLWPLLLLDQSSHAPDVRTLPLGIYRINAELQEEIGVVLALATIIVIPIFIILFLAQDYIKKGVTVEGLKG